MIFGLIVWEHRQVKRILRVVRPPSTSMHSVQGREDERVDYVCTRYDLFS